MRVGLDQFNVPSLFPQIAHESSVKAQVRLAFTNITGQPYTINRSMQATQAVSLKCFVGFFVVKRKRKF